MPWHADLGLEGVGNRERYRVLIIKLNVRSAILPI